MSGHLFQDFAKIYLVKFLFNFENAIDYDEKMKIQSLLTDSSIINSLKTDLKVSYESNKTFFHKN